MDSTDIAVIVGVSLYFPVQDKQFKDIGVRFNPSISIYRRRSWHVFDCNTVGPIVSSVLTWP